jgi:hypothetical protein
LPLRRVGIGFDVSHVDPSRRKLPLNFFGMGKVNRENQRRQTFGALPPSLHDISDKARLLHDLGQFALLVIISRSANARKIRVRWRVNGEGR